MFAKRTDWELTPNPLTRLREIKERRGDKIWDLTESNPTRCGFSFYNDKNLWTTLASPQNLRYEAHPQGLLKAREAVCVYYAERGITVLPEDVFLTSSTSEAYGFIFKLMTNPGDSILIRRPSYPLFDLLAQLHDSELVSEPRPDTKLAIFVNPNNPTGFYVSSQERDHAIKIMSGKGAVLSDEVFFDFPFKNELERQSFAAENKVLTFTLSGISKVLGLPQMKLAWIVVSGPRNEKKEAAKRLEIIADTFLSVNTPVQNALPAWLSMQSGMVKEMRERIHTNRSFLTESFKNSSAVEILNAEAGWYSVLKLDSGFSEENIATALMEKCNVYVHPGYFFDYNEGAHLVLSHILPPDEFREAVGRMVNYLDG